MGKKKLGPLNNFGQDIIQKKVIRTNFDKKFLGEKNQVPKKIESQNCFGLKQNFGLKRIQFEQNQSKRGLGQTNSVGFRKEMKFWCQKIVGQTNMVSNVQMLPGKC